MLAACSSSPEIVDNGNPGKIKVIVFFDDNGDGNMDAGEPELVDEVGISQDISCPAGSMGLVTVAKTDSNGETTYTDLPPGRYCVANLGDKGLTTKLTNEVNLSSDQVIQVIFGLTEQ